MVRAVMVMMWPLAAAASSLRALSTSVPFYAYPPLRRVFGGSGHSLSAVYLGLSSFIEIVRVHCNMWV